MKLGFICATIMEAQPLLDLACCPLEREEGRIALTSLDSELVICGMGPDKAARAAEEMLKRGPELVIHFGICGGLRPEAMPGKVFIMQEAVLGGGGEGTASGRPDGWPCDTSLCTQLERAVLVTWPVPVFDARLRERLARWGHVVDMEGAAIARKAKEAGIPCHIIKGVTDIASEGERERLRSMIDEVSETVARQVWRGMQGRCATQRQGRKG